MRFRFLFFNVSFPLTVCSAWWGQSFVQELTRISEQADRKVKFAPRAEGETAFHPKTSESQDSAVGTNTEATDQQARSNPSENGAPVPQQKKDEDLVANPS